MHAADRIIAPPTRLQVKGFPEAAPFSIARSPAQPMAIETRVAKYRVDTVIVCWLALDVMGFSCSVMRGAFVGCVVFPVRFAIFILFLVNCLLLVFIY